MQEDKVDLRVERQRTVELLESFSGGFVPLPVAAAATFHDAYGETPAILGRDEYHDAFNIAAAALSRLVALYGPAEPHEGRKPIVPDLTRQHFARGASELRSHDGTPTLRDVSVKHSDLSSALSLIKRAGLPFSFAVAARTPVSRPQAGAPGRSLAE